MLIYLKAFFWLVFIIGIVIFIHEFGHFIAAKLCRIVVEEFAFGFGKKLIGKKIGGTEYKINIIPYGGYVRLLGEEEELDKEGSFSSKSLTKRVIVITAGVFMNFVLAVFIFYMMFAFRDFSIFLPRISDYNFLGADVEIQDKPIVENVIAGTPAEGVDFPTDVVVWGVDSQEVKNVDDFVTYLSDNKGNEIEIKVLSFEGEWKDITVVPNDTEQEGVLLGVEFYNVVASFYRLDYQKNKLFSGLSHSVNFSGYTFDILKELIIVSFEEKSVKPVSEGVSGVVGVANRVLELVKVKDFWEIFNLMAGVNLSLAIMNLLPIPGLDGGYLLFFIIEKFRGKKMAEKYKQWAIRIGFIFLISLGIIVTLKDIIQFDIVPRFFNAVKSLF